MSYKIETRYIPGYGVSEFITGRLPKDSPPVNWPKSYRWESIPDNTHLIIIDPDLHSEVLTIQLPIPNNDEIVRKSVVRSVANIRDLVLAKGLIDQVGTEIRRHVVNHENMHASIEENNLTSTVHEVASFTSDILYTSNIDLSKKISATNILLRGYLEALVESSVCETIDPVAFSIYLLNRLRDRISVNKSYKNYNPENFINELLLDIKFKDGNADAHELAAIILTTGLTDMEDEMWRGIKIYNDKVLPKFLKGVQKMSEDPGGFIRQITNDKFISTLYKKVELYTNEQLAILERIIDVNDKMFSLDVAVNLVHYGLLPEDIRAWRNG